MKRISLLILMLYCSLCCHAQLTVRQERNLTAFCKLYGYVRFFNPSDEAQTVNWGKFAIYGSKEVIDVKNDEELIKTLESLYLPLAPSLKLGFTKDHN